MALHSKPLERYENKRNFRITSEPAPDRRRRAAAGNSFVIQKHAARRLHYDFRLELDGVLKSWAVTRGPSLDPADRRLAVHVEDHPAAYGGFEGIIPQGQYGGGTVMVWDRGTWEPEGDPHKGYAQGKLKFTLHGERLNGGWTLVRMGGRARDEKRDNWLLIKERDEFARPGDGEELLQGATTSVASGRTMEEIAAAPDVKSWQSNKAAAERPSARPRAKQPSPQKKPPALRSGDLDSIPGVERGKLEPFIPPQLATLVDRPPDDANWIHEIKIDGYRIYARCQDGAVRLMTRTGQDWTHRFKPIAAALSALPARQYAIDGEIAVLDERGTSNFSALQEALSNGTEDRFHFIAFDLLHLDGYDLRQVALRDRKSLLRRLLAAPPASVAFSDDISGGGATVFAHACQMRLEGVVSKRADRPYESGRSGSWVKSKCVMRQEFVIGGFTDPKTARAGIGALAIGYYKDGKFHYAGRVGTGFSQMVSQALAKQLRKLAQSESAFVDIPREARRSVHWVKPSLVCEVEFLAWTRDGVLRHPSFQGLREDKPAVEVKRESPMKPDRAGAATSRTAKLSAPTKKTSTENAVAGVTITHPDRVVFPADGITKLQLAEYYGAIAKFILPHLVDRPLSLLRCPGGIGGECFFQKHFATGVKSLPRIAITEKSGTSEYLMIRNERDLILLIQEGVIEIHPWGARGDDPDKPDQLIFDLDPAPDLEFAAVVEAALAMRSHLDTIGLRSFAKTTGGKGLHVVVPLRRGIEWKALKEFALAVGENFVTADPARFTVNSRKAMRARKIFIDYLRNDRGSTAVAPYVVRARPGAPVALPLDWKEITPALRPDKFTLATVPALLRARKRDPWADIAKLRQTITPAMRRAIGMTRARIDRERPVGFAV
jgi:bifunctional non-homologous end joining protein LigD